MSHSEIRQCIGILSLAYPRFEQQIRGKLPEVVSLWEACIGDIPFDVAKRGCERLIASSEYPPTIAELRRACVDSVRTLPTATEAYAEAVDTIHAPLPSAFTPLEDEPEVRLRRLSPLTQRVVRAIGWEAWCSGQPDVLRGQFLRMYEVEAKDARTQDALPESVKPAIAARNQAMLDRVNALPGVKRVES